MSFVKVLLLYKFLKSIYPGKFLERSFNFFYIVILFYCMCYCSWCKLHYMLGLTLHFTVTLSHQKRSDMQRIKCKTSMCFLQNILNHSCRKVYIFKNCMYLSSNSLSCDSQIFWLKYKQRARATNSKYGPVDLLKNENDREGLKEWLFNKWIPADFMSVVMTSFSNRFLHYDVINSVIITEIQFLCWN